MTGPFSNALMTIVMENHDKLKKASDEPTDAFDTGMDIRDVQNSSGYDILQIVKKFEMQTIKSSGLISDFVVTTLHYYIVLYHYTVLHCSYALLCSTIYIYRR